MKLDGRYAIITGAGQGLGEAIAERYVAEGASVVICARNEESLALVRDRLVDRLSGDQQIITQQADVSAPADVEGLVETALANFPHLDILVNNAGVYGPIGYLEAIDWDEWVQAININLLGTVYASRAVLPHFKSRGYGKIVNLSGGGATGPLPRISAYAASKSAVVRFTETLAVEVADFGIEVNAIAPGALATRLLDEVIEAGPDGVGREFHERMLDVKARGGTPLNAGAALAVYLGSSESDGISGRLLSAEWDDWQSLHHYREVLEKSDIYTLRRIVPADRGVSLGDD